VSEKSLPQLIENMNKMIEETDKRIAEHEHKLARLEASGDVDGARRHRAMIEELRRIRGGKTQ
jgi:hypothetical protein